MHTNPHVILLLRQMGQRGLYMVRREDGRERGLIMERRVRRDERRVGKRMARPRLVVQQRHFEHSLCGRPMGHVRCVELGGDLPLPLVPSVLKPNLHLGLGEVQLHGQSGPLRGRKVSLHIESGLELVNLGSRKHRTRLLLAAFLHRFVALVVRIERGFWALKFRDWHRWNWKGKRIGTIRCVFFFFKFEDPHTLLKKTNCFFIALWSILQIISKEWPFCR